MDPQKTAPFELGSGGAPCLLVHGFTGSPWDMRPLGEALARQGYFVRGIRLPGHGSTAEAFGGAGHPDWLQAVEAGLLSFGPDQRVFVAGLSMGALLSLLVAMKHPDRVRGLALLAPAIRFRGPTMFLLRRVRRLPGIERLRPYVVKDGTDIQDPTALAEAPLLAGFPSVRLKDLFHVQDETRRRLAEVRVPCLVVVATEDHVVSVAGGRELARGLVNAQPVRFIQLREGFHILPRDKGAPVLFDEVLSFFRAVEARENR